MTAKSKTFKYLPILAITAFVLSFAVVNYNNSQVLNTSEGMVLSDRDENSEEIEKRNEERVEATKRENEQKSEEAKKRNEVRKEVRNRSEIRVREVESESEDSDQDEFELESEGVKARTGFPLKLDTKTNELMVAGPSGETKDVAVLPDKAVENLLENKRIELIDEPLDLVENKDKSELEYRAEAVEEKRFLGLFKIRLQKEFRISSETGEVDEIPTTGLRRLLDLLSF
jgi:hypothetical protein